MAPPDLTPAWLAEHVLGWHLVTHKAWILSWWCDSAGYQQAPEMFDPLHVPADALRVLDAITARLESRYSLWCIDRTRTKITCKIANEQPNQPALWCWGEAPTLALAICRAAQAWVLSQEGEHGTGT